MRAYASGDTVQKLGSARKWTESALHGAAGMHAVGPGFAASTTRVIGRCLAPVRPLNLAELFGFLHPSTDWLRHDHL
jgi:hypothetical protein